MLVGGFSILSINFQVCVGRAVQAGFLLPVVAAFAVKFGTCILTRCLTACQTSSISMALAAFQKPHSLILGLEAQLVCVCHCLW